MGLTETCQICKKNEGCGCTFQLTRFFELALKAFERVSSNKPSSAIASTLPSNAIIDKLILATASPLQESIILERLRQNRVHFRKLRHRDHRWCYEVGSEHCGTYLRLWAGPIPTVNEIVTRPSAFNSYQQYLNHIDALLAPEELEKATIKRLDLAIDYDLEFQTLIRGLDFRLKQLQTQFSDKGGKRTGLRLGKGTETIQIYDKAAQTKLPNPKTRIEFQLKGQKLPCRKISEIQTAVTRNGNTPFNLISLSEVSTENPMLLNEQQKTKRDQLEHILSREGLFAARRLLNHHNNFSRDYGPILKITPWQEQPQESFQRIISDYFNPTEGETHGTQ